MSRMEFLAGVLDWHSDKVPTPDLIAGLDAWNKGERISGQLLEPAVRFSAFAILLLTGLNHGFFAAQSFDRIVRFLGASYLFAHKCPTTTTFPFGQRGDMTCRG